MPAGPPPKAEAGAWLLCCHGMLHTMACVACIHCSPHAVHINHECCSVAWGGADQQPLEASAALGLLAVCSTGVGGWEPVPAKQSPMLPKLMAAGQHLLVYVGVMVT